MKKIIFFAFAFVLAFSSYSFSASFEISTDEIFAPGDPNNPVTVSVSSMDISVLDMRLYEIDDPEAYFLGLKDIHSPTVKTKRDVSGTSEMIGGMKRKTKRLIRQDYRSLLTVNMRKDVVSALGLPHASEAETKKPETFELYPILKGYKLVKRWNEELVIKKPGRWEYHDIAIDVKKPGCYLVEAVYQDNVAYTAIIVTTLAFVVKNSPTDDLVYVADRVTGKPVANVRVSIWGRDKKKLTSGKTNSDGVFYNEMEKEETEGIYVFASKGDSFTIADPYTYFYWYESKDKVYTYTDRPVYRPGHTVYFRSIIREGKTDGLVVPKGEKEYLVTIKDSKGNEVYRKSHSINEFGSLSGELVLGAEPPLGEYEIIVEYKDDHFYSNFKVEEYKKPEFEVKVNTDKPVYILGDTINADIEAKYYFGSPVNGGEVECVVYKAAYKRPWWWGYDWAWYYMDSDYYWGTKREMVDTVKGKLDDNGKLSVSLDTSRYVKDRNNDYTFTVEAKVTDLSRREIKGTASVKVARASFAMVIRTNRWVYSPNDEAKITVKTLDFENKGVANVKVNLIVTEMKRGTKTVTSTEMLTGVTNPDGEAVFTYRVKEEGKLNFSASAFDFYGNSTSSADYAYSYTWGRRYGGGETEGGITIVPDKNSYTRGDVAHILILTPTENAHVLVTSEARSIIDSKVINIEGGSAMIDIPIEDEHTPNIFLTASMVFNNEIYTETKKVIIPATHKFMNVEITSDKEIYEPQEEGTFTIKTTDYEGKPVSAEVSLAMVDAAIYAIAPDNIINIEKYFYKLRPHVVETTSSLYFRFYGYSHRKGLLSALDKKETTLADFKGDTGMVEPEIRKDFKDTMYWSPAIKTGLNGKATVTLKFPDNLTRWRGTARAITTTALVGESRHRVISRKDMIVRIEAPRFFRQGDEMLVSTIAHNYLSEDKNVRFTFDVEGLKLFGGGPKEYVVPKNSERRIDWKIKAEDVGDAVLTAKAMTNEVSDGMELTIPVLPRGLMIREDRMGEILKDPGNVKITLERPLDTVKNSSELVIDLSPTLVNTMVASIPYLVGYPYGCNEQVMSRFLPSIMVSSVLNKLELSYPEIEKDLPKYINSGLMVLYRRQHDDNGWGWYENDETTPHMTAYVLYGLLEADRILPETSFGIRVDKDVIRRGTASLISQLPDMKRDSDKVYALYVLSFTDRLKLEWLDEMFDKRDKLTTITKAMLLLSYEKMGIDDKAKILYDMLMAERVEENGYVHWGYKGEDFYWWEWEADELETTAYMLKVMAGRDLENPLIAKSIRWLIVNRTGNYWRSTKASAKIIDAFSDYLLRTGEMNPDYELTLKLNGSELKKLRVTKKNILDGFGAITVKDADIKPGKNVIEITKDGPGTLYYSTTFTYYVERGDIAPEDKGFKVERWYYILEKTTQDGKMTYVKKPLSGPVKSGDEILVELHVSGKNRYNYFLLEDYFPSGCEAIVDDINYRIAGDDYYSGRYHYWWWYAGREFRDERIAFSLRNFWKDEYTFKYILRAQIPGVFDVMPAKASLMYYPTLSGRTGSGELVVNDSR